MDGGLGLGDDSAGSSVTRSILLREFVARGFRHLMRGGRKQSNIDTVKLEMMTRFATCVVVCLVCKPAYFRCPAKLASKSKSFGAIGCSYAIRVDTTRVFRAGCPVSEDRA